MLDAFEKESRLQARREARQRQMRLMEEAASGVSLPQPDDDHTDDDLFSPPPPSSNFVDEDSEDDVPSMYSDYSKRTAAVSNTSGVSSNLWGSGVNKDLDEDKLNFVMGGNDDYSYSSSKSSRWGNKTDHIDESRKLIKLAGRRVSGLEIESRLGEFDDDGSRRTYNYCGGWINKYSKYTLGLIVVFLIVMGVVMGEMKRNANHSGEEWPPRPSSQGQDSFAGSETASVSNQEEQTEQTDNTNNVDQPQAEIDLVKFSRIKDRLLEHQISHASSLEDPTSAQYKALTWIVRDDPRQLDVSPIDDESPGLPSEEIDAERTLFERYALVVFWFETTDLEIVNKPTTGRPFRDDDKEYTQSDIQWKETTDWLSKADFCNWYGVVCHSNGDHVAILNLTDNNVHGLVPREVYVGLSMMQALDLSGNSLGGGIGWEIGELRDLQDLFLQSNHFTGAIPTNIGQLSSLYNLNISDNRIGGSIPTQIGQLRKLRDCSMFKNRIEGKIPDEIGELTDLLALYLDSNRLTGKIPKQISLLTSLVDLRLRANKLTGTIPTELGALTKLETMYLDTNSGITGNIPTEFGNFIKATEIQLYQNSLTGPLPSELGLLDGLVYLYLDSNELTGSIPEDWGGMRNLEQLFLSGNKLKGEIPGTIRGMENLQYLRASDNQFSGTIPTDMGKMLKMEYLYLEENDLDGPVPFELGELYRLKLMHLDGNNLSGAMPEEICKLKTNFFLLDLSAANNDETFSCACCTDK